MAKERTDNDDDKNPIHFNYKGLHLMGVLYQNI